MKKRWQLFVLAIALSLLFVSCQTVGPGAGQSIGQYLEVGLVDPQLKGGKFYSAMGRANLYIAGLIPLGSADVAVAVLVNDTTGKIMRIVTLQATGRKVYNAFGSASDNSGGQVNGSSTVYGDYTYGIDNLVGGVDAVDVVKCDTWAKALESVIALSPH